MSILWRTHALVAALRDVRMLVVGSRGTADPRHPVSEDTTLREAAKETLARDSGDEAESARLKRFADALAAKFNPEGNDGN